MQGEYNKEYAVADALATDALYIRYMSAQRPVDKVSINALQVFGTARLRGMYVNKGRLAEVYDKLSTECDALLQALTQQAAINWNTPSEVGRALRKLGVPLEVRTESNGYSTSEQVLSRFRKDYEVVNTFLEYKSRKKLLTTFYSTYEDMTQTTDLIHPTMKVLGTSAGRTSCTNPNIQQVPSVVKPLFTSRFEGGRILQFDLAQSELRCAVLVSGDQMFAQSLAVDAHKAIMSKALHKPLDEVTKEERKLGKAINFGVLYGATSAHNMARRIGSDVATVKRIMQTFWRSYPRLKEWQERQKEIVQAYSRGIDHLKFVRDYKLTIEERRVAVGIIYANTR